jgi:hypothetical protein
MSQPTLEWSFREISSREIKTNPEYLEFFSSEALRAATDALVREDIQNRLDAIQDDSKPVEVRYKFISDGLKFGDRWFRNIRPNLEATEVSKLLDRAVPDDFASVPFLLIEDFNTSGLRGDPKIHRDPPVDAEVRNDFFWFIRNVGRSGKANGDRGRWGLGKIVYPASSEIRSFFSFSVTADASPPTLIGRSVLCIHSPDGVRDCAPDGFMSYYDEAANMDLPSRDSEDIEAFKNAFRITRGDEPGLSLAIPFPKESITGNNLILSLIDHWFWVFLDRSLLVRVYLEDGAEAVLGADTLDDVIERFVTEEEKERILRKTKFAREVIELKRSESFNFIIIDGEGVKPIWSEIEPLFGGGEMLEGLRSRFNDGELLGFQFKLRVTGHDGDPTKFGGFDLFIRRSTENHRCIETTLREGLAISGVGSVNIPGVSVITYVGNNPVGTVLGDSENPAHTHWRSMGMNKKYPEGAALVKLVSGASQKVIGLLTRVDEGLNEALLEDFFSIPDPEHKPKPSPTKKGTKKDPPPPPDPKQKNFYLNCHKLENGFKIVRHENANQPVQGFVIRAAYEVAHGNPFKKHHLADFDFSHPDKAGIEYIGKGVEIDDTQPSRLRVIVTQEDFHFSVIGFDPHRDLLVDVKPIKQDGAEADYDETGGEE